MSKKAQKDKSVRSSSSTELNKKLVLAGVDEAGRGPLAGPVVTTAVVVKDPEFDVRIDDSKKLTLRGREKAYNQIIERCSVSIAMRDHECIDLLNIYQATVESMLESIDRLVEKPDIVLIDGNMKFKSTYNTVGVVQGDSKSLAIACASIVSKVTRDRIMKRFHKKYPEYGFDRHKGYGTAAHMRAIRSLGPCNIHRRSFEPIATMVSK